MENAKKINIEEFNPRVVTSDVVSKINWPELTDGFNLSSVHFFVERIGSSKEEKIAIIKSIYKSEVLSDSIYDVPYELDRYLSDKYREFGGEKLSDLALREITKPIYYSKLLQIAKCKQYEKETNEIYQNFFKLLNNFTFDADKQKLDYQNLDLENENKILKNSLSELQEKYRQLEKKYKSQIAEQSKQKEEKDYSEELNKKESEWKAQLEEMDGIIKTLREKIGNETIPLRTIIDAIKKKAKLVGISEAFDLFEKFSLALYDVEVWRNNRFELENFFAELSKPSSHVKVEVLSGGIAQITEKEIINGSDLQQKLLE